jgi:hypothetical protein
MIHSMASTDGPLQRVIKTYYYADGGTVGIAITDPEQTELRFSFPSDYRDDSTYSKLFVGDLHKQRQPMTEISPMEPTAEYLRQLLRSRVDDANIAYSSALTPWAKTARLHSILATRETANL